MAEPHVLDTAPREEIEALSLGDIRRYASHLGIINIKNKTKAQLIDEMLQARTSEPADEPAPITQQNPGYEESPIGPGEKQREITPEEARRIDSVSDAAIKDWLDRRQNDPEVAQCLIEYGWLVLAQRADARMREQKRREMSSEVEQYEVTKGRRLVVNGLPTMLATGSVVSPTTHDIEALKAQGIELRRIARAVADTDDRGLPYTRIEL